MRSRQTVFLSYLQHYAAKNPDAVAAMLADDVTLRDWKLAVVGKAAAVAKIKFRRFAPIWGGVKEASWQFLGARVL